MQTTPTTLAISLALTLSAAAQEPLPSPHKEAPVTKSAPKQAPAKPDDAGGKKAPFVFEAGTVELVDLIERCGSYLQFNILIDDSQLQLTPRGRAAARRGRGAAPKEPEEATGPVVHLQLPVVTDHDGCEELLSSMLWSQGLALVALDEQKAVYEILHRQGPRMREIVSCAVRRTPEQVLARPMLRSYVQTIYLLEHTNAQLANNALRPFYASTGSHNSADGLVIGNVGNKRAVLLSGPQFMVASALRLLKEADVPETELPNLLEQRFDQVAKRNEALQQRVEQLEKMLRERTKK